MSTEHPETALDDEAGYSSRAFEHFIVMAGASCSGKSTLADRLVSGGLPELARTIGFDSGAQYHPLFGRDWDDVYAAPLDRVLVQYDLTDSNPFADRGCLRDATLELLERSRAVTFLTVWEAPEELDRRLQERFRVRGGIAYTVAQQLRKRGPSRAWHSLQRFRQRRRLFNAPKKLWTLYQTWFESCARVKEAPHWILRSTAADEPTRLVGPPANTAPWETNSRGG